MGDLLLMDRSNILGDLAASIRDHHAAIGRVESDGLKHAIAAGKQLIEAKKQVKTRGGSWIKWIEENCKFTRRLANQYMRVSKMRNAVSHLSFREAIKQTVKNPRPERQTPMETLAFLRKQYISRTTLLTVPERRKELIELANRMGFGIDITDEPVSTTMSIPGFKKQ